MPLATRPTTATASISPASTATGSRSRRTPHEHPETTTPTRPVDEGREDLRALPPEGAARGGGTSRERRRHQGEPTPSASVSMCPASASSANEPESSAPTTSATRTTVRTRTCQPPAVRLPRPPACARACACACARGRAGGVRAVPGGAARRAACSRVGLLALDRPGDDTLRGPEQVVELRVGQRVARRTPLGAGDDQTGRPERRQVRRDRRLREAERTGRSTTRRGASASRCTIDSRVGSARACSTRATAPCACSPPGLPGGRAPPDPSSCVDVIARGR